MACAKLWYSFDLRYMFVWNLIFGFVCSIHWGIDFVSSWKTLNLWKLHSPELKRTISFEKDTLNKPFTFDSFFYHVDYPLDVRVLNAWLYWDEKYKQDQELLKVWDDGGVCLCETLHEVSDINIGNGT